MSEAMPGEHFYRGRKRAREVRRDFGLDPHEPLRCLLTTAEEAAGIPVIVRELPPEVAGCVWSDGDGPPLVHLDGRHALPRQRFTLAHDGRLPVDDVETVSGGTYEPRERRANAFAAELLVLCEALEELVEGPPCLDELALLAAGFGVSVLMLLFRLRTCDFVESVRYDALRAEIDEGLHLKRHHELQPPVVEDSLASIEALPPLFPVLADSALAAALAGTTSVAHAAQAAGVSADGAAAALGEPGPMHVVVR